MTGGGPGTQTYTASFYLYTVGFTQFHLSQATAGSWLFLILTALVVMLPGAAAAQSGAGRDGTRRKPPRRRPRRAHRRSGASCSSASSSSSCSCRSTGCSTPRSSRATTTSPSRRSGSRTSRRWCTTRRRCSPIAASQGLINSLIISTVGDDAVRAARHADGLQPRALQHRRPAPVVLGAVAALPAADRHRAADLPDLPQPRPPRHAFRPDPRLHRVHPAGDRCG